MSAARQSRNRRRADILVRSNVRRADGLRGNRAAPTFGACCGQECPRSGTACGLLAACEQSRLLQCREESDRGGAQSNHLSVTDNRVTETSPSLRPSRLCGLATLPSNAPLRLHGLERLRAGTNPNHAATRTGWSSLRLTYCKHARTSSGSRSGSSSRTCWEVSPFDSKSRTSVTRMRMPRMQGRPPHCSGSKVIRFIAKA